MLDSTLEEVVRLSRITEDLLTLARSDCGALAPKLEETRPAEVVQRIAERLGRLPRENGATVQVLIEPDEVVTADATLLGQAAWNLIENALNFSPAGGVVTVSASRKGDDVVMSVTDQGPGFDDEPTEAFERFYRADRARARLGDTPGTGLGLAIVKAIAEAHGGEVEARNLPGGGAAVSLRFPRKGPVRS